MKKILWIFSFVLVASVFADEVRLEDGTLLKGAIKSVGVDHLELETSFAGTVSLDRTKVTGFSTDEPLFVRLLSGAVMPGKVTSSEQGYVKITGVDGTLDAPLTSVQQGWIQPENDPEILAREQAVKDLQRTWKYQVAANVSGKSGNTDEKSMGGDFSATLAGKNDELKFYASYSRQESNGEKTTDERKAGMRYTSYFNDPWGWYVRQELEGDEFENIKLRSVTAGGISRRFVDKDHYKLSANAGTSYRYETYKDGSPDNDSIGLDFGLQHFYRWENRFEINNELSYIPSLEDFANYLITQNSWLDFPLGDSKLWKVRVGLRNDYNSRPGGSKKKQDTTYYSSLVAEWD